MGGGGAGKAAVNGLPTNWVAERFARGGVQLHRCIVPREFNRETVNLAELQARITAAPFVPFRIVLSSGKTYDVPTADHLTISRLLHRVSVEYDDGTAAYINLLHITAIEPLSPAGAP